MLLRIKILSNTRFQPSSFTGYIDIHDLCIVFINYIVTRISILFGPLPISAVYVHIQSGICIFIPISGHA